MTLLLQAHHHLGLRLHRQVLHHHVHRHPHLGVHPNEVNPGTSVQCSLPLPAKPNSRSHPLALRLWRLAQPQRQPALHDLVPQERPLPVRLELEAHRALRVQLPLVQPPCLPELRRLVQAFQGELRL